MQSHLGSSTSQATTFPTSAQDYTLHEKVGKGSSSTVGASCSSPIKLMLACAPQATGTLSDLAPLHAGVQSHCQCYWTGDSSEEG